MKISYTAQNEEKKPVYIEANLDFGMQADDTGWMLWAFAPLRTSAESIDSDERERLAAVVSTLEGSLELSHGAEYAGMRIQDGWAELYFYAVFSKGAEKRFKEAFHAQGYSQIEFGSNRDAGHTFYHEQLAPDVFELQQAKNSRIIDELAEAGDTLDVIRPVEHYLFFQTRSAMQRTADVLALRGRIDTELKEEGEYPYGLMIEIEHACTPEAVNAVSNDLIESAQKAHGVYLGWSTTLATKQKG